MGLGLTISKQIVEHFGGKLTLDTSKQGAESGSTFTFTFKLQERNDFSSLSKTQNTMALKNQ